MIRRFLPPLGDPASAQARALLGEFEGYVSLALSVVLSALKAWLGMMSGSISLLADAANNLADIGSSLVVALGFRWSRKPRDLEHPYGHGRAEAVVTLVLSMILIGVAIEVAQSGIQRLLDPEPLRVSWGIVAAVLVTVGIKSWLAGFAGRLAKATGSETLRADAWNHRFDILSTSLVLLALVGARIGWSAVDGWAGLGVSLFIGWTGARFAKSAVHTLIGEAPPEADLKTLEQLALGVDGVRGTHEVAFHAYGDVRLISLHIEVDANLTVLAAHEMAERVEAEIAGALNARVVVHVDPVDRTHPAYEKVEEVIHQVIAEHPELIGFHDLRVAGTAARFHLAVDLIARPEVQTSAYPALLREAREQILRRIPETQAVEIGIESEYVGDREHRERFTARPGGAESP
jgi:cation diffusion facilitator family transporter